MIKAVLWDSLYCLSAPMGFERSNSTCRGQVDRRVGPRRHLYYHFPLWEMIMQTYPIIHPIKNKDTQLGILILYMMMGFKRPLRKHAGGIFLGRRRIQRSVAAVPGTVDVDLFVSLSTSVSRMRYPSQNVLYTLPGRTSNRTSRASSDTVTSRYPCPCSRFTVSSTSSTVA